MHACDEVGTVACRSPTKRRKVRACSLNCARAPALFSEFIALLHHVQHIIVGAEHERCSLKFEADRVGSCTCVTGNQRIDPDNCKYPRVEAGPDGQLPFAAATTCACLRSDDEPDFLSPNTYRKVVLVRSYLLQLLLLISVQYSRYDTNVRHSQ